MLHVATRTRARPLLNTLLLLLLTTTLQPTMAQSIALLPTTLNPLGAASSIIIYATTVLPQVTVVQTLAPAPVPAPAVTTTVVQVLPAPVVPVTVTTTAYLTSAYCLTTLPNWYPAQTAVCPAGAPVGCVGSGGSAMNGFCCAQGMYCQAYAAGGKVRRGEAEGEEEDVLETDWDGEGDGEGVVERGVVAGVAGVGCCPYGKVCECVRGARGVAMGANNVAQVMGYWPKGPSTLRLFMCRLRCLRRSPTRRSMWLELGLRRRRRITSSMAFIAPR